MVWFRVDDTVAFHPKVLEAGNAAMGLWVRAGAWSAANLTDGFVPIRIAERLGSTRQADALVACGLFEKQKGGYFFHDWSEKNFTKQQVEANREGTRRRVAEHRKRRLTAVPEQPDVTPLLTPSLPYPSFNGHLGGDSPVAVGATTAEPPRVCPNHPGGTRDPCGACADYRKANDAWQQRQYNRTQEIEHAKKLAAIEQQQNCPLNCADNNGYRPNGAVCDHIDRTQIAAQGSAAVREALNEVKARKAANR